MKIVDNDSLIKDKVTKIVNNDSLIKDKVMKIVDNDGLIYWQSEKDYLIELEINFYEILLNVIPSQWTITET